MAFPVLNATFEMPYGLLILGATLSLVDFVRNPFGSGRASLELIIVWIIIGRGGFDKGLPEPNQKLCA